MKLTPSEKLIVSMLASIMKHLKVEDGVNPDFVEDAVHSGHTWALDWEYQGLGVEEDKPEVVQETADILQMWFVIEGALDRLTPEERADLEKAAHPWGIEFRGFDGNSDPHFGVASFLVNKMRRFEERKGKEMNSHSHLELGRYRSMLERYNHIAPNVHFKLRKVDLAEILKAEK